VLATLGLVIAAGGGMGGGGACVDVVWRVDVVLVGLIDL